MAIAIDARGLKKAFGVVVALRGIDLQVEEGRFLTLLGPNGAGKTTLLRLLATLGRPTAGQLRLFGQDVGDLRVRRDIGVISHQLYLFPQLTAAENLRYFASLYGVDSLDTRVEQALAEVEMSPFAHRLVGGMSRGMMQRLSIARAVIHEPRLVLLDEPFTGLDPHGAQLFTRLLTRLRDGRRTVVLVTHHLEQSALLSDEILIQVQGRLVARQELGAGDVGALARWYLDVVNTHSGDR